MVASVAMVVGGNGQLGSACCEALLAQHREVRVTVRDRARAGDLESRGAEVVLLDVTDAGQRRRALRDVDVLILSANSVVARAGDDPAAIDRGLDDLVDEALSSGVGRVVLPSVPAGGQEARVALLHAKRRLEERLSTGPAESWILRLPPFMEVWFALVGSSIPLRGEPNATIGRPSPFLRRFRTLTGSLVEDRGLMLVPGPATNRNAFISVKDAARACVAAAVHDGPAPTAPLEVTGPEVLSWRDLADLFAEVLDRPVRVISTPAAVYATAARLLAPIAPVPSRTMALNVLMAATESATLAAGGGLVDPATMVTAEVFLRGKAAMGPDVMTTP
jgi:uncharacterized protein YbjT (DUF2867 family)